MQKGSVAIIGVGAADGLGAAIGRIFAQDGYSVHLLGRTEEKLAEARRSIEPFRSDVLIYKGEAHDENMVQQFLQNANRKETPVRCIIFNAGVTDFRPVATESAEHMEQVWREGALAGFFALKHGAQILKPLGNGSILLTGATSSLRGAAGFAAFAGAKAALRSYAQSAAKELGPEGVHVAHLVIDGMIAGDRVLNGPPMVQDRARALGRDGMLSPDGIARNYLFLHDQPSSAWTFELDLRPYREKW